MTAFTPSIVYDIMIACDVHEKELGFAASPCWYILHETAEVQLALTENIFLVGGFVMELYYFLLRLFPCVWDSHGMERVGMELFLRNLS